MKIGEKSVWLQLSKERDEVVVNGLIFVSMDNALFQITDRLIALKQKELP